MTTPCLKSIDATLSYSNAAGRVRALAGVAASLMLVGMAGAAPVAALASVAVAAAAAAESAQVAANSAWSPATALPIDSRVVMGELPNGMKYVVMKHANPPGRVAVWMHISSGSLNETDPQRGLAHYLEHLAFNGSENFPPGTVIDFFQSLGLRFGQHQNAFTSFDQTVYQLALPDNSVEKLDKALLFFADVNGRLLLDPKEIDEERQVIMEEKASRKSAGQRLNEAVLKRMAPGSIVGERLPIGVDETILGAQRELFAAYYNMYYTPANSTVIAVGDMEPAVMIERITAAFAALPSRGAAPADQDAKVTAYTEPFGVVVTDAEMTRASLSVQHLGPARGPSLTEGELRRDLMELIGSGAFNRRVQDKVARGEMAVLGAGASAGDQFGAIRVAGVRSASEPSKWREALTQTVTELQRARVHGFLDKEVETAKTELLASFEQGAKSEATLPAQAYLNRINSAIADREPIMSSTQLYELAKMLITTITTSDVSETFKTEMDLSKFMVAAQLPAMLPDGSAIPTEAELVALVKETFAKPVEAMQARATATALMEKAPQAGKVAESLVHEATGVMSAWLSNGVRFHHRAMDYRRNQAQVSITLYGGDMTETAANRGITGAAGSAWATAATSKLSSTDILDLMAGVKVEVGGGQIDSGLVLAISGDPADMETGFKLANLLLTDPFIEPPSFEKWKISNLQSLAARDRNPASMLGSLIRETSMPEGDARFARLTEANIMAISRDAAQARLLELVRTSPIEVSIVGDISREKAQELAEKYLGSLPARERVSKDTMRVARTLPKPMEARSVLLPVATGTPIAASRVQFYGPDANNLPDSRSMQMSAQIITSRMIHRLREELQLVYSISAGSSPATVYSGYGVFGAGSTTQPGKTDQLAAEITSVFDEYAKNGPTEEEVEVAKKQFANTMEESMREPAFWSGRLSGMTFANVTIDDVLSAPAAMQSMSASSLKETFARYWGEGKPGVIITTPAGMELLPEAMAPGAANEEVPKPEAPKAEAPKTGPTN